MCPTEIKRKIISAFAHLMTGALFAGTMSVLVVICPSVPLLGNPFLAISRIGTGWGMGVYADRFGGRRRELASAFLEPRLVFLDLSQEACEAFYKRERDRGRCQAGHPAQPELVFETLKAVLRSRPAPAVVILDAALIDRQSAPLWPGPDAAALPLDGPPVIYSVAGRRSDGGTKLWLAREPDSALLRLVPRHRLVVAAARTFTIPDGTDQGYPPMVEVRPIEGGTQFLVPSVPYAAAIAVANRGATLRSFADALREGQATPCEIAGGSGAGEGREANVCLDAPSGTVTSRVQEILYSLRSLAYDIDPDVASMSVVTSNDSDKRDAAYVRVRLGANAATTERVEPFPAWSMADAVVVIGTSALSAEDVHATPIGPMAGPEVVLNAVRSFLRFATAERPGLIARLEHKAILILITTVIYLPAWLSIEFLVAGVRHRPTFDRAGIRAGVASIFVLAFLASAVGMTLFEVYHSTLQIEKGEYPPDLLTPLVAFSLEGFAEGAVWFLRTTHYGVEILFHRMLRSMHGLRGRPN